MKGCSSMFELPLSIQYFTWQDVRHPLSYIYYETKNRKNSKSSQMHLDSFIIKSWFFGTRKWLSGHISL